MKLLLDTHLLIWTSDEFERLSPAAAQWIGNPSNDLLFSVASIWEIAIKSKREDFNKDPAVLRRALLDNGYGELLINSEHAIAAGRLPQLHKDPFDRLLVAQATIEGLTLLTADAEVAKYPGAIQKV